MNKNQDHLRVSTLRKPLLFNQLQFVRLLIFSDGWASYISTTGHYFIKSDKQQQKDHKRYAIVAVYRMTNTKMFQLLR